MPLPYTHQVDTCFAPAVAGGLTPSEFNAALQRTTGALDKLRSWHADGSLPLLRLAAARDDLVAVKRIADRFRREFNDVVILGTGGSSLGGQALYALSDLGFGPPPGSPRLRFLDNIDPATFEALFKSVRLARTGFVAISKSGSTAETMTQLIICLDALRREGLKLADHVAVITEQKNNVMRRMAASHGFAILDHDPNIGGRFAGLTNVGLLPALARGLDVEALREGASTVVSSMLDAKRAAEFAPAIGAAIAIGLAKERDVRASVMLPYADRLARFAAWYVQLWGESLGKDGEGVTPVAALGPVDQHSQLQLYLDGAPQHLVTVIREACEGRGPRLAPDLAKLVGAEYLAGHAAGDLVAAEQRAIPEALIAHGRPVRTIDLEVLDERALGALMMHFMVETILAAHLLGVDPFGQPAVESGKMLTRRYLAGAPAEPTDGHSSAAARPRQPHRRG